MVPNHNSSHLNLHMYRSHPFVNKLQRDENNLGRRDPVRTIKLCSKISHTHGNEKENKCRSTWLILYTCDMGLEKEKRLNSKFKRCGSLWDEVQGQKTLRSSN